MEDEIQEFQETTTDTTLSFGISYSYIEYITSEGWETYYLICIGDGEM
jgi:hypothetical protein